MKIPTQVDLPQGLWRLVKVCRKKRSNPTEIKERYKNDQSIEDQSKLDLEGRKQDTTVKFYWTVKDQRA